MSLGRGQVHWGWINPKNAQGELFMIRNGHVTDVGPPHPHQRGTGRRGRDALTAVSGGPEGGIIRASIYYDHMGSVATWQARYSPWRPQWTCRPHASQTVIEGVHGDAAPEPATGQVSRPSGLLRGRTSGGTGRTISGEGPALTRPRRSPAGDHHALAAHREGTFDAAGSHQFVGASRYT